MLLRVAIDVLVETNLRGIDGHGIGLLPYYLEQWNAGRIFPDVGPMFIADIGLRLDPKPATTPTSAPLSAAHGSHPQTAPPATMVSAGRSAREAG